MARPAIFFTALFFGAVAASVVAWQEHGQLESEVPTLQKAALLQSENDVLRDALAQAQLDATTAKNALKRSEIERSVAAIRGLNFTQPVVYDVVDRAGIRQLVGQKLSAQYTDQEIDDVSTGLSAFGLLPPHFPLKQTYIDLLGEQIAAFYDQHQHKLFMFNDASLENAQNRVILAHELTHALQDQNFGLLKLPLEVTDNDDRAAAASALIEGDATLVMSEYMQQDLSWRTFTDTVAYSASQSMVQIRRAPRYLREMLVFPYIKGEKFCEAVYERGGYAALSAVYADPPSSTAQILHPEKYFPEGRENPIAVTFHETTFHGEKPLDDNVLGEMGARLLFEENIDPDAADSTAAGWRGDRYLVFDQGNTLVWKSVWRSPAAATAAAEALEAMCARRFHLSFPAAGTDLESNADPAHSARIQLSSANEVVFVLSTTKESSDVLYQQFAGASHG
jgi:hypothetical protein